MELNLDWIPHRPRYRRPAEQEPVLLLIFYCKTKNLQYCAIHGHLLSYTTHTNPAGRR
jgi:hypothetical protein